MQSLLVIGDVRYHSVEVRQAAWKGVEVGEIRDAQVLMPGGALMMAHAIKQMTHECRTWLTVDGEHDSDKVDDVIGCLEPIDDKEKMDDAGVQLIRWEFVPCDVDGTKRKKARLIRRDDSDSWNLCEFSPLSEKVVRMLTAKGFDTWPDVIVFDDLRLFFRNLRFQRNLDGFKASELQHFSDALANVEQRKQQHEALLTLLFHRFFKARQESLNTDRSTLEPVIIGSIRNKPGEIFNERWHQDAQSERAQNHLFEHQESGWTFPIEKGFENAREQHVDKTVWLHLLDDVWLRRRVVILLEASDLRDDGLSISTGLSWERTAQDTISQLRHSPTYRQFLQFGHVIVRYGVTGALYIESGDYQNSRSYTLFFDPEHDDSHWSLATKTGEVLGDSSVYVAQFVKAIQKECRKHGGTPELVRLGKVISDGIVKAIKSNQLLSRTSYGESWPAFRNAIGKVEDSKNCRSLPSGVFCTRIDPSQGVDGGEDCTHDWTVSEPEEFVRKKPVRSEPHVAAASIPPSLQRRWSILMQSAMVGDMLNIASRIVRYGATEVFNFSQGDNYVRAREVLIQYIIDVAYEHQGRMASDAGIRRNWEEVCAIAIDRFNDGERAPIRRREHHKLNSAALVELKKLRPNVAVFKQRKLWHHLNQPNADLVFERIFLAFAPKKSNDCVGFSRSLTPDPIVAPMIRYGKKGQPLFVVDRREVEGYRAVEILMRQHLEEVKTGTSNRPLCISVFGPPGSGKSFAVKRINDAIEESQAGEGRVKVEVLPAYNLGQFADVKNLETAFEEISARATMATESGKTTTGVPIAFFDEFDSSFGVEEFGWLKFFLAPMEDGIFGKSRVHNAILVFAGGTRRTFDEFSMANRPTTDEQFIKFSKAKGPDFASRLSGHLDIVGINTTGTEDELFMIRRAMVIRSILSSQQSLKEGVEADIDDQMNRALLKAPGFRNGSRSIRMLLELCRDPKGRVSASEIPPIHQLNMHVDGKAFLDLLHERPDRFR